MFALRTSLNVFARGLSPAFGWIEGDCAVGDEEDEGVFERGFVARADGIGLPFSSSALFLVDWEKARRHCGTDLGAGKSSEKIDTGACARRRCGAAILMIELLLR